MMRAIIPAKVFLWNPIKNFAERSSNIDLLDKHKQISGYSSAESYEISC